MSLAFRVLLRTGWPNAVFSKSLHRLRAGLQLHRHIRGGRQDGAIVRELRNGAVAATYLTGPRGPEYRRDDAAGAVRWYVYDGLGSVVGEVAPDGSLTCTRKLDVYGCVRSFTGTATSKHKFVGSLGHPSDDETGLIYMRARHYDPACGRFVSEDPARNGANWFQYANADSVNNVDATGKDFSRAWAELWAMLLAAAGAAGTMYLLWSAVIAPVIASGLSWGAEFGIAAAFGPGAILGGAVMLTAGVAVAAILGTAMLVATAYAMALSMAIAFDGVDESKSDMFSGPGLFGHDPKLSDE